MKKQLLFAFLILIFLSFSTRAQVGFTCDNPIEITTLPYQVVDGTSNYGNTIAGPQSEGCGATPASTNYLSGNDVVYRFTAPQSGYINISMNPGGTRSSIFVYDECLSIGTSCLAGVANTSANPRIINQFAVVAAEDYYIVISSNVTTTPTLGYELVIQYENCQKPTNLTFDQANATLTGGTFSWTENGTATSWQLAVQNAGELVPEEVGNYADTDGIPSMTINTLEPGHLYQYWVRSVCTAGGFSAWAGPFVFNTLICQLENQCTYTFRMTDAANNGWNGAQMQIRQNGIVLPTSTGQYTIGDNYSSGSGPVDVTVSMCNDVPFDVFWLTAGTQPQQCILSVINSFGQTVYTKPAGTGTAGEVVFNGLVDCDGPTCNLIPSNVTISYITTGNAKIDWQAPGTENLGFHVFVLPTGAPAPTFSSIPTFFGMNGPTAPFSFTIPEGMLTVDTAYDVYVRVDCEPTSVCSPVVTFTTLPSCPKPINLSVQLATITTTSANLVWTEAYNATEWEVLLLPSGPEGQAPPAPGVTIPLETSLYFQGLTTTTLTVDTLTPATIYYYYVRAVCGGNDPSSWSGPYIFNTITCNDTDKCQYKFILTDLVGNGWNGARMQVRQNGIVVATLGATFNTGLCRTINVNLCNDVPFDVYWNLAGVAPNEVGFLIQNPFGDIIYTYVPGTGIPLTMVYDNNILGNCTPPTCPKPTGLQFVSTSPTSASLSWSPVGTENSWEVYVIPTMPSIVPPVNGSPVSGVAPYYMVSTNPSFEVTDLTPGTSYTYYVRAICSETDVSNWASFFSPCETELDKIKLVAFLDLNNNTVKDINELNFTHGSFTYQKNNMGTINTVSSPQGSWILYDPNPANTYDFWYQINPEYSNYYALTPTSFNDLSISEGSGTQYLYFPVTITQEYSDVEVKIIPITSPRPGFTYTNKIVYRNNGIVPVPVSGTLTFTNDSNVTITNISQLGTVSSINGFTFDYTNLLPAEVRYITVTMTVPSIPIVNIDDVLTNTVSSTIPNGDINIDNNDSTVSQIVIGAYDPNDKNEAHGESIDFNSFTQNDYLVYTIRFQNTGTANAINVRIEDVLDAQLDETTIQMISASHDYVMERINNKLIWTFKNIQLPPQITNEEASNGYVTFKIKPNEGFTLGDIIPNFAEIYFDTNPAIITNTFTSTFEEQLATPEFTSGNINVYPNPSNGLVYINVQNTNENLSTIKLYDVLGKMVLSSKSSTSKQSTIDVSALAKGVYMIEITMENNFRQIKRLVVN